MLMFIDAKSKANAEITMIDTEKCEIIGKKIKLHGIPALNLKRIKDAINNNKPEKLVVYTKGLGTSYSTAIKRHYKKVVKE